MSKGQFAQSLQEKVSITLFFVMGALALLSYVTLQLVVAPAFDQLEQRQAKTNLVRAERAIRSDLENLNAITGDWALWDDAYDYVRGDYPAFEDSNLARPTLENLALNLLAVYDADGALIWGELDHEDHVDDIGKLGVLGAGSPSADFLIRHKDPAGQVYGLLKTALQRTEVELDWRPVSGTGDVQALLGTPLNLSGQGSMRHETRDGEVISTGILADLFGAPLLELEVRTPREISALGHSTVNGALAFLALAAVIIAIVTWLLLRGIIVRPLGALAEHITVIRKSGDLKNPFKVDRRDEIGALGQEFNKLTGELHEARRLLLDQSFKAGKADTAAEVLHNIRNAMTPLINGIDRLGRHFGAAGKLKVRQAIGELSSGDCPAERAGKLLQYIDSAFAHIEAGNEDAAGDLEVASKQARQVEAILADQERHAKVAPVIEKLSLDEVMDEAVLVIPKDDARPVAIDIESDLQAATVQAHRVSLLQVLGNVVLNAWESIQRAGTAPGHIRVVAREETVDEKPMVRLIVGDNGCGFDDDTAGRIFQRGFSSKEGNLSGLGLHWCANALAGMGGRIQAQSAGPGRGAEFHVLLPAAQGGPK